MINQKAPIPYNNFYNKTSEIKDLVPLIDLNPRIENIAWLTGLVESNERMEIPKNVAQLSAIGFPWHENAKGRLTTPNYGTYKISLVEEIGGIGIPYSSNNITGIRRASYQTHNGLLLAIMNANNVCEIWHLSEPYGAIVKRFEMTCGYAQRYSFTHDPLTDDVWVSEYGEITEADNPRRIYHSPDGGINWVAHEVDTKGIFRHLHTPIYHPPTGNLYVSTGDDGGKHVYKSTDRGVTWTQIPSAIGRKLVSAVVRHDGVIVWGNDEAPTGIYLHNTLTDTFTSVPMYNIPYRGYNGSLNWSNPSDLENSILMIPTREQPYNPPGIFATKDFSKFHRILDTTQEGEYDMQGVEAILGPDDKGYFYAIVYGLGPVHAFVFKAPNIYQAVEVDGEATAALPISRKISIIDCLVPKWATMPLTKTELLRLTHANGYVSVSLESDGKVSLSDGVNTSFTGTQGDAKDLLIKWDGLYDQGVQFPFVLEISETGTTLKVLNRVTHEWAIATINSIVEFGDCTLTTKGNAKHQVKTSTTINVDAWVTLLDAGVAIY